MSAQYLLPCRCGQKVVVERRQAGETVICPCGQSLPVPTLIEMTALEAVVVEEAPPTPSTWGWQERIALLGAAMLAVAVGTGIWLYRTRPIPPSDYINPDQLLERTEQFTPVITWSYWRNMQQGLDCRTSPRYEAAEAKYHVWRNVAGIVALVSIAMIVAGMLKRKKPLHSSFE